MRGFTEPIRVLESTPVSGRSLPLLVGDVPSKPAAFFDWSGVDERFALCIFVGFAQFRTNPGRVVER